MQESLWKLQGAGAQLSSTRSQMYVLPYHVFHAAKCLKYRKPVAPRQDDLTLSF
jgi:hypothetical protein